MASSITSDFFGTLGNRQRHLNALVRVAHQQNISIQIIQDQPEVSPTDRLFKIDLASKQRNVDYIIHTLKDKDMLYVSRALKSLWLLETEHSDIINPKFLEHELFTQMTLQAANKTRHWVRMHLRDSQRCKEFYQFYKDKDFDTAARFLWHCSDEFVLREITDILNKITPKHLKVLSEKVPQVTRIYYENLKDNQDLLNYYLKNETKFLANLKYLLKPSPDVFFYVLENFAAEKLHPFNTAISEYIVKHHKNRLMEKPELYTERFLDMNSIAKCLSSGENKRLVWKLEEQKYLKDWFSDTTVEQLKKRLYEEERKKKLEFVAKSLGPTIGKCPYPIPVQPVLTVPPGHKRLYGSEMKVRRRKVRGGDNEFRMMSKKRAIFDENIASTYKQNILKIKKRLTPERWAEKRQYMVFLYASMTRDSENLAALLDLSSELKNEPVKIRAEVVRNLVKVGYAWRLTAEYWAKFLEWGHGLGLDGSAPEAACSEGLHAVVIRDLIAGVTPQEPVWKAFLRNFSTLAKYPLSVEERNCIIARLPPSLLSAHLHPQETVHRLDLVLDTLKAYKIRYDKFPDIVEAIAATAKRDLVSASGLLIRLYIKRVARRRFIRENFEIEQTDNSYLNALRHDISILDKTTKFEELTYTRKFKHVNFLRKVAVYFTEKGGLAERYRAVLESRAATRPDIKLARPLALLAGSKFPLILKKFEASRKKPQRRFAAALRSNAHVVRPVFDLESLERAAETEAYCILL